MALHKACRGLALTAYHSNSLSVERVSGTTVLFIRLKVEGAAVVLGDFVDVIGLPPRLEERHNAFDLLVRDKRAMDPGDAAASCHVEHVAATQELLCTTLAEDSSTVDLRRHLKADSSGKIRFDGARDNVDRRALSGHDDVDTGGACHLRQPLDRCLDLLAGDQHQIGHL